MNHIYSQSIMKHTYIYHVMCTDHYKFYCVDFHAGEMQSGLPRKFSRFITTLLSYNSYIKTWWGFTGSFTKLEIS